MVKKYFLLSISFFLSTMLIAAPKPQQQRRATPAQQPAARGQQQHVTHHEPKTPLGKIKLKKLQSSQKALQYEQSRFAKFKQEGKIKPGEPMYKALENNVKRLQTETKEAEGALDKTLAQE